MSPTMFCPCPWPFLRLLPGTHPTNSVVAELSRFLRDAMSAHMINRIQLTPLSQFETRRPCSSLLPDDQPHAPAAFGQPLAVWPLGRPPGCQRDHGTTDRVIRFRADVWAICSAVIGRRDTLVLVQALAAVIESALVVAAIDPWICWA